jgi:hypothetical protein
MVTGFPAGCQEKCRKSPAEERFIDVKKDNAIIFWTRLDKIY